MRDVRMRGFAERADVEEVDRFLALHTRPSRPRMWSCSSAWGAFWPRTFGPRCRSRASSGPRWTAMRCVEKTPSARRNTIQSRWRLTGSSLPGAPLRWSRDARSGRAHHDRGPRSRRGGCGGHGGSLPREGREGRSRSCRGAAQERGRSSERTSRVGDRVLARNRRLRAQDAGLLSSIGRGADPLHSPSAGASGGDWGRVACGRYASRRPPHRRQQFGRAARAGRTRRRSAPCRSTSCQTTRSRSGPRCKIAPRISYSSPAVARSARKTTHLDCSLRWASWLFHGISMRPSSPAGVGRIGDRFVFLLPGNPVSCLCAYEFFAGPTLRGLGGRSRGAGRIGGCDCRWAGRSPPRSDAPTTSAWQWKAEEQFPLATSGASILSSTVRAAGLRARSA